MIKKLLAIFVIVSCLFLQAPLALAGQPGGLFPTNVICNSQQGTAGSTVCNDKVPDSSDTPSTIDSFNPISGSNGILLDITNILDYAVGAASIIMIIVGSIRYIISNGDSNKITAAKSTIIYSLVGIAVAVAARALIVYLINSF